MKRTRDFPSIKLSFDDDIVSHKSKRSKTECPNPDCKHQFSDEIVKIDEKYLDGEYDRFTIEDLIYFGKKYHCKLYKKIENLDLEKVCRLIEPLTELQEMVGIKETKDEIAQKIISMLDPDEHKNDMMHSVVMGPPGVGKTTFSRILPKIFVALGRAKNSTVNYFKVKDLMGEYCGHTQPKVEEAFKKSQGGFMIIDEAYALGNKEKKNVFTEEMINCINQNMDLYRDVTVIFLGYEKPMMENLFSYNDGLFRRIAFVFRLGGYNHKDLTEMLIRKLSKSRYKLHLDREKLEEIIKNNEKEFPYFGGDIETLVAKLKIACNNRTLLLKKKYRREIREKDIMKGIEMLKKVRLEKDTLSIPPISMYL